MLHQEIFSEISEIMQFFHIPGVSIAIANGRQISSYTFGKIGRNSNQSISPQTAFQAGSISKGITALLCLALVKKGLLSLDEEISLYLKELNIIPPGFPSPSIRDILCHSSGFNIHGFRGYSRDSNVPDIGSILKGLPPANNSPIRVGYPPRSHVKYSGGGYVALQYILSCKLKSPFEDIADINLFSPSKCEISTFGDSPKKEYAIGHTDKFSIPFGYYIYPEKAAAGLWTCPSELLQLTMHIYDSIYNRETQILTKHLSEEILLPHNDQFGLGFRVKKGRNFQNVQIYHGGINNGYESYFHMLPYLGRAVIIMTNLNSEMAGVLRIFRSISKSFLR